MRGQEIAGDRRELGRGDAPIDQQGSPSRRRRHAPHLGVQQDGPGHGGVGAGIDIGVAEPIEMGEDGNAALALHPLDQPTPAARDDHVDAIGQAQQRADRPSVGRWQTLDRILRQARLLEPPRRQARIAAEECRLSEPPRRIAALPARRQSAPASAVTLGRDS